MLRLWLPLNGDLHNQGLDDATSTVAGTVKWSNTGKIGKGFDISGGYARYTVPSIVGTNIFSVSFWYKPISNESITANWNKILVFTTKKTDDTGGALFRFESSYNGGTSNTYAISVHNNIGEPIASVGHTLTGEWDKWHHIVAASDGTNMYTYCDNVLIRTSKCNGGTLAGDVYVGYSGAKPNGIMNDVRVYDHCLSLREVKEISKGLVLHYPLNRGGFGADNYAKNTSTTTDAAHSGRAYQLSSTIPSGTTVTISCRVDADNVTLSGNKRIGLSSNITKTDGSGTYWFETWKGLSDGSSFHGYIFNTQVIPGNMTSIGAYIQTLSSGTVTISDVKVEIGDSRTPWIPNSADALYSAMGLDDGIEYDVSGYGNNGIQNNTPTFSSDTPRYKTSIHFNGTNQTVKLPNLSTLIPDSVFTFNVWFKRLEAEPSSKKWETILGGPSGFELESCSANNVHDAKIKAYSWGGGNFAFEFDKWNMLTMVQNGTNALFYLNGELKLTGTFKALVSGNYFLGSWRDTTSQNYRGYMSDARIYSTALSADDILALYHTPTSIASNGTLLTQGEISEV